MTQSDLMDWKRNPVTQEIMYEFKKRQEILKEELVEVTDMRLLHLKQGAILAYNDFLDIEPEGEPDGN